MEVEVDDDAAESFSPSSSGFSTWFRGCLSWSRVPVLGVGPCARSGHVSFFFEDNVFVFSGYSIPSSEPRTLEHRSLDGVCYNDLFRLHLPTGEWHMVPPAGGSSCAPSPRCGAAVAVDESGVLYVCGGSGSFFGQSNVGDLWRLNLRALLASGIANWENISDLVTGRKPPPLYGASLTYWKGMLYAFGGTSGWLYFNTLHALDLSSLVWTIVTDTQGNVPTPRHKHQAVVFDERLYLLGGSGTTAFEVHSFDFRTRTWAQHLPPPCDTLENSNCDIAARGGGGGGLGEGGLECGNGVSGGSGEGDGLGEAAQLQPLPRCAHSCVILGDSILMYGGNWSMRGETWNEALTHRCCQELWALDPRRMRWTLLKGEGSVPSGRLFHAAVASDTDMYVTCGTARNGVRTSSVFRFRPRCVLPSLADLCTRVLVHHRILPAPPRSQE
eukprot:gnl/Spiro4/29271_TR14312_c0_g2_i1.p1 gnl/Spiro4/29271_TR14312_c0_g2~~gnl/Spiro4/29271_TR14312_c0_g2_i1.p1  ORF type:complete len:442 (-),score=47.31 gnl/Spiro4/29271_TR14312_c0_g2_i1:233-1558(-)